MAWPPTAFTLHGFFAAAASPTVSQAIVHSLIVASVATVLALVLGALVIPVYLATRLSSGVAGART